MAPSNPGIKKNVLHAGRGDEPNYPAESKLIFHYKTVLEDGNVLDDTRGKRPMELVLGHDFQFEAWELCVKTMREGEVAEFIVNPQLSAPYPAVAGKLRGYHAGSNAPFHHHCCGSMSTGHQDLDELMAKPQSLKFIIDLQKVHYPDQYERDLWSLSNDEQKATLPRLREQGRELYKDKDIRGAQDCYGRGLAILEQLMLKELPKSVAWLELLNEKLVFLSNYAQCALLQDSHHEALKTTDEVLQHKPDDVKALFRRAKAYMGTWDPREARRDLNKVLVLDPSLQKIVDKELEKLAELEKEREKEERVEYSKMF